VPLHVSLFAGAFDERPTPIEVEWPELARRLTQHEERDAKLTSEAWSFAEYAPGTPRKLLRYVTRVHGWTGDLDDVDPNAVADLLTRLPWAACFYTTWAHSEASARGLARVRVAIPFSRPVDRDRWPAIWRSMVGVLAAPFDGQCKDATRISFGPFVPRGTLDAQTSLVVEGPLCDPYALPAPSGPLAVLSPAPRLPVTKDRLEALLKVWRRQSSNEAHAEALAAVLKGDPFATPGARDITAWSLACALARALPDADAPALAQHFMPSLSSMGSPTIEEMIAKFERAFRDIAADAEEAESHRVARIRAAFAHVDPERDFGYLPHEIEEYCAAARCNATEWRQRWILQRGREFRFFCAGRYSPPYGADEAGAAALRELAPAETVGVELRYPDGTPKGIGSLTGEYGTAIAEYVYDLRTSESSYDPASRTYVDACAPIRIPTERIDFDPEVQEWLDILGGDRRHELIAWLSRITHLDRTTCALLLVAPAGVGKSLLASGLAKIWTTGKATTIEQAMSGFNEPIVHCPLVVSDEVGIPKINGKIGRTSEFRRLVSDHSHDLRKKYAHDAKIKGALRLLFVANNEGVLSLEGEHLNEHDIGAIAERFFCIDATRDEKRADRARDFLSRVDAKSFVEDDRIARHVLWLRDNFEVPDAWERQRFLLSDPDLARKLALRSGLRSAVLLWCVNTLRAGVPQFARSGIRVHEGELWVQPRVLYDTWALKMPDEKRPSIHALYNALRGVSRVERHLVVDGEQRRFLIVDSEMLLDWCEWSGESVEAMIKILTGEEPTKTTPHNGAT
jgi:hypothetical protein